MSPATCHWLPTESTSPHRTSTDICGSAGWRTRHETRLNRKDRRMGEAKTIRYFLDILAPGQGDAMLVQFSALTPFQAIHVGDILHSQSMLDSADSMDWLRVVGVVHRIWDLTDHISHLTTVYTVAVSEQEALSFGG